ncbi:MAG: hypothetical protein A3H98_00090 [Bacteroidetes bacterium RIFCSPLOWO2_02_FULL_36_8]|nr:MAG: hypothetical protein A3H98_00090 [Bacteroidetes bacterium RIFCSPLOWO2_02_FULL_36_8]OFY69810.1 MAG: hypothetical protein A3G23_14465 [Bacteroidetes bacterium RIFCSPLOWO2_12_FULL_37_12]
MKNIFIVVVFLISDNSAFPQFSPAVGNPGTSAIHKDSSVFISWATDCHVNRGFMDISNPSLGFATAGDSSMSLGKAGENGVVSLGDGGIAVLTFISPIKNGVGWDFAVFENSFSDDFLELAFVEVSSDGINFFRFPVTSLTQDTVQIGTFGLLDPKKINNLAGKYRAMYGTPFDLEELSDIAGLDINRITHIKIIDVTGSINENYSTFDQYGVKINDPYPTPFESGGFDLDALGVIHQVNANSLENSDIANGKNFYPNPVNAKSVLPIYCFSNCVKISMYDILGNEIYSIINANRNQDVLYILSSELNLVNGVYYLCFITKNGNDTHKIIYIE